MKGALSTELICMLQHILKLIQKLKLVVQLLWTILSDLENVSEREYYWKYVFVIRVE